MDKMQEFNPKVHICKFGFELYDHATFNPLRYNVLGNLYEREIIIEFIDKKSCEIVDVAGFKISDEKLQTLLPIIRWCEFEKYRDLPARWEWDFENGHAGYRDGWWYDFWCLTESGDTLLQIQMTCLFSKNKLPAYEVLLKWLRDNYRGKRL